MALDRGVYERCSRANLDPRLNPAHLDHGVQELRTINKDMLQSLDRGRSEMFTFMSALKGKQIRTKSTRENLRHFPKVSCYETCFKTNNANCLSGASTCSKTVFRPKYKVTAANNKPSGGRVLNDLKCVAKVKTKTVNDLHKAQLIREDSPITRIEPATYRKTAKCAEFHVSSNSKPGAANDSASSSNSSSNLFTDIESNTEAFQPNKRIKISPSEELQITNLGNVKKLRKTPKLSAASKNHKPAKENDFWGTRGSPLLGYDWIAGSLDNAQKTSVLELPDEYFQDLKSFRDACCYNDSELPSSAVRNSMKSQIKDEVREEDLKNTGQCIHKYRVASKPLSENEKDIPLSNRVCRICYYLNVQANSLPKYTSVLISKEKAEKQNSAVFDIPIRDSLALVQNCVSRRGVKRRN